MQQDCKLSTSLPMSRLSHSLSLLSFFPTPPPSPSSILVSLITIQQTAAVESTERWHTIPQSWNRQHTPPLTLMPPTPPHLLSSKLFSMATWLWRRQTHHFTAHKLQVAVYSHNLQAAPHHLVPHPLPLSNVLQKTGRWMKRKHHDTCIPQKNLSLPSHTNNLFNNFLFSLHTPHHHHAYSSSSLTFIQALLL